MYSTLPLDDKYLSILGDQEIDQLALLLKYQLVEKNEVLIFPDKPVRDVYYIKTGVVRLFLPDEKGREVNTHLAWNGMFISSYYSLINQKLSDESVVTITPCELFHFDYYDIAALFDTFPKIERLCRILAEEAFSCLAERGRMLQTMTAKERYLYLMKKIPKEVFCQIPMQEIASFIGIAPGSLSRIRNEFLHIC